MPAGYSTVKYGLARGRFNKYLLRFAHIRLVFLSKTFGFLYICPSIRDSYFQVFEVVVRGVFFCRWEIATGQHKYSGDNFFRQVIYFRNFS
jgi:hypothetical protein